MSSDPGIVKGPLAPGTGSVCYDPSVFYNERRKRKLGTWVELAFAFGAIFRVYCVRICWYAELGRRLVAHSRSTGYSCCA